MIPAHLRPYVVRQNYEHYTPINQATWRYVMRQFHAYFENKAHPTYYNGLRSSGITVDAIPNIDEMNACMARYGWQAVVVDGLVPTAVFMDFQAHRILPISVDIRTLDHLGYTPAPDIIHETAGHAPILIDPDYSAFIERFGEIGARAFSSKADHRVYEATKHLSVVKEDPHATPAMIAEAEAALTAAKEAATEPSEETLAGRLYWWTVEYGMIGTIEAPKLYGAGLLSSVSESQLCLTDRIKKLPFDLEACINTSFDITTYQPQLFVCESFEQLLEAVNAFAERMSWRLGGTVGLERAMASEDTGTAVLSSGLAVTGTVSEILTDGAEEAVLFRVTGPVALAVEERQLPGHGREDYAEGTWVPLGRLEGEAVGLEELDEAALRRWRLEPGRVTELRFASGLVVSGTVAYLRRHAGKIVLVGFESCTIRHGERLIHRTFGELYHMPVGETVVSAYAGAADKAAFHGTIEGEPPEKSLLYRMDDRERRLQGLYQEVRQLREQGAASPQAIEAVAAALDADYPEDWLLRLELLELLQASESAPALADRLREQLRDLAKDEDKARLIADGLALIKPAHRV